MNDAWPWNSEIKNLSETFVKQKDRMSKYGNWINSDDILAKNALFNITELSRIMIRRPFLEKCTHTDLHFHVQVGPVSKFDD